MSDVEEQPPAQPAAEAKPAAFSEDPTIAVLLQRIADLELRLSESALLHERVQILEERKLGVSLEGIKDQIGSVEGRIKSIESRRDAWLRTLFLTLAAPLAAGLFGQFTLMRDIRVKKFDQNLALVDRALDYEKGEAYRAGILEYIIDLNTDDDDPIVVWATDERQGLDGALGAAREEAEAREQQVADKRQEVEDEIAKARQMGSQIASDWSESADDPDKAQQLAVDSNRVVAAVQRVKTLESELEHSVEAANVWQERAGKKSLPSAASAPDSPAVKDVFHAQETKPRYFILVGKYPNAEQAKQRAALFETQGHGVQLVVRGSRYMTLVGPFLDDIEPARVMEESQRLFERGLIRRLDQLCPLHIPGDVILCLDEGGSAFD